MRPRTTYGASLAARSLALLLGEAELLSDEIERVYEQMRPIRWFTYPKSHLAWHRKRRVRKKWRRRLGWGEV